METKQIEAIVNKYMKQIKTMMVFMLLLVNIMVYSHTFYDDLDPSLLQF